MLEKVLSVSKCIPGHTSYCTVCSSVGKDMSDVPTYELIFGSNRWNTTVHLCSECFEDLLNKFWECQNEIKEEVKQNEHKRESSY